MKKSAREDGLFRILLPLTVRRAQTRTALILDIGEKPARRVHQTTSISSGVCIQDFH